MGEGTFGRVFKAANIETNELVAIKRLKSSYTWETATQMPEIQALKKLNNHQSVIKIIEMSRKNEEISIVFEYCERNLFKEMETRSKQNKPFSEQEIRLIVGQALSALAYVHKNGYIHRDIKPENFLIKDASEN